MTAETVEIFIMIFPKALHQSLRLKFQFKNLPGDCTCISIFQPDTSCHIVVCH